LISCIFAFLTLFVLQTLLPASFRYLLAGPGTAQRLKIALGPRDSQPPMPLLGARADRALTNLYEALPVFLTLALLHVFRGTTEEVAVQGAWLFVALRALYVPAYLSGLPMIRSLIWMASWIGLGMMLAPLISG
jgi:uncharacterized MAPEG superfamily protein